MKLRLKPIVPRIPLPIAFDEWTKRMHSVTIEWKNDFAYRLFSSYGTAVLQESSEQERQILVGKAALQRAIELGILTPPVDLKVLDHFRSRKEKWALRPSRPPGRPSKRAQLDDQEVWYAKGLPENL